MKMRQLILVLLSTTLGLATAHADDLSPHPAKLTIHAAASLEAPLKEALVNFGKQKGETFNYHFGNSDELARAIKDGAGGDLFFGAGLEAMAALVQAKVLIKGTREVIYTSNLVIVIPHGDIGTPSAAAPDLANPEIKKIGLIKPESAPAGVVARAYLEKAKLWERVQAKVVPYEDSKALLAAVDAHEVDAAILFKSEALVSKQARLTSEIEPGAGQGIAFQIALLAASKQPDPAANVIAYLAGPEAAAVFEKYGFRSNHSR